MTCVVEELSAAGHGAISIVRVSGSEARARVARLLGAAPPRAGSVRVARVCIDDLVVDEALIVAPADDVLELHLHGSPPLVRRVRAELEGVRDTPRGVTLETRAHDLLRDCPSEAGARILLDQGEGALGRALEALASAPAIERLAQLEILRSRSRVARFALEPARVVLAGPVNAGKSTLFNVLVGERRAIESDEPGTTRDVLRATAFLGAYPIELIDTAGERELEGTDSASAVERAGLSRARVERERADLVLWLEPADTARPAATSSAIRVLTQADRCAQPPPGAVSARLDPAGARRRIAELFRQRFSLPIDPWTSGAPCAFDAASRASLESLAAGSAAPEFEARVRRALDAT